MPITGYSQNYASIIYLPLVMEMNSEALSTGVLAVIITIPSLLALMMIVLTTTIIVILVHKRRTYMQGTQDETYYSTVGPPLPPANLEKNMSYGGNLEYLRIADKEQCHHDTDDSDQFYEKITEKCADTSIHHQPTDSEQIVTAPVNENAAYCPTSTATAVDPEIQTEENVAYSQKLVEANENIAYGTNIAIAPEIQTEENVAYSRKPDDNPPGPSTQT